MTKCVQLIANEDGLVLLPRVFMHHGDVVEVEIERTGTIRNPVLNQREGQ